MDEFTYFIGGNSFRRFLCRQLINSQSQLGSFNNQEKIKRTETVVSVTEQVEGKEFYVTKLGNLRDVPHLTQSTYHHLYVGKLKSKWRIRELKAWYDGRELPGEPIIVKLGISKDLFN